MSYTPNMSKEDIMKQDQKRGLPDSEKDLLDTYPKDDHPKDKKPWAIRTPVNKGTTDMRFLDSLKDFAGIKKSSKIPKNSTDYKEFTDQEEKELMPQNVEKALNTKSLYIPRPKGTYDPFNTHRSATDNVTRRNSRLKSPQGIAPLVGETLEDVSENERNRTENVTFKSCGIHGVIHKSSNDCRLCTISKSSMCKTCGDTLKKYQGGGDFCETCTREG